jgi:tRNA (guanine-N7-)-methyltransferase
MNDPLTIGRLYGRRAGHKLRVAQAELVEDLLPRLTVPPGPITASALFGDNRPLWLEIGFGGGPALLRQQEAAAVDQRVG